jgi:hypothetical protein
MRSATNARTLSAFWKTTRGRLASETRSSARRTRPSQALPSARKMPAPVTGAPMPGVPANLASVP